MERKRALSEKAKENERQKVEKGRKSGATEITAGTAMSVTSASSSSSSSSITDVAVAAPFVFAPNAPVDASLLQLLYSEGLQDIVPEGSIALVLQAVGSEGSLVELANGVLDAQESTPLSARLRDLAIAAGAAPPSEEVVESWIGSAQLRVVQVVWRFLTAGCLRLRSALVAAASQYTSPIKLLYWKDRIHDLHAKVLAIDPALLTMRLDVGGKENSKKRIAYRDR